MYVRKLWNEEELEDEKLTTVDQTYSNQYGKITNGQEKERFLRRSFLSMLFIRFFSYGDLKPTGWFLDALASLGSMLESDSLID